MAKTAKQKASDALTRFTVQEREQSNALKVQGIEVTGRVGDRILTASGVRGSHGFNPGPRDRSTYSTIP